MEIKKIPGSESLVRTFAENGTATKDVTETRMAPLVNEVKAVKDPVPATDKQLEDAIERINRFLDPTHSSITFTVDKDTNLTVVKVIDTANNTIIRQMPTEEALAIAKDIDKGQGFLLNTKA